jgi:hypothetical protein
MGRWTKPLISFFAAGIATAAITFLMENCDRRLTVLAFAIPISFIIVMLLLWSSTRSQAEVISFARSLIIPLMILYIGYVMLFVALLQCMDIYKAILLSMFVWVIGALVYWWMARDDRSA